MQGTGKSQNLRGVWSLSGLLQVGLVCKTCRQFSKAAGRTFITELL